jgi:hypothetical protein
MMLSLCCVRVAVLATLLTAGSAVAHEGHDHADESKAGLQVADTPRLEATSGPFELVALVQQGDLVIYLDEFETNTSITNASMVVETPVGPVTAEAKEGIYRLAAPWAKAGSHSLIFTVTASDRTEILSGTLTVTPDTAQQNLGWSFRSPADPLPLLIAIVAFGAGVAATLWARRRKVLPFVVLGALLVAVSPDVTWAHEGHDHAADPTVLQPGSAAFPGWHPLRAQARAANSCYPHRANAALHPRQDPGSARPHYSRSQCQRFRTGVGQRTAVSAGRRLPKARHPSQRRRRAGVCHPAVPGHRRFRHAPEGRRAGSTNRHRRQARRAL